MHPSLWDDMLRAKKGYSSAIEPICRQWELTRNELDVLLFLANNPNFCRAVDIVERRGIAKSHVSTAVKQLQRRGFLERIVDSRDGRNICLCLTEAAMPVVKAGQERQKRFFQRLLAGISPEEQALWQATQKKISENIANLEEI